MLQLLLMLMFLLLSVVTTAIVAFNDFVAVAMNFADVFVVTHDVDAVVVVVVVVAGTTSPSELINGFFLSPVFFV